MNILISICLLMSLLVMVSYAAVSQVPSTDTVWTKEKADSLIKLLEEGPRRNVDNKDSFWTEDQLNLHLKEDGLYFFDLSLKENNLSYKMPEGFSMCEESIKRGERRYCNNSSFIWVGSLRYSIQSDKHDIVIGFQITTFTPSNPTLQKMFPSANFDFNTYYRRIAKYQADTVNYNVVYYSKNYSKEKFNSDAVVEYTSRCELMFRGKYPYCRVVFLQRKNRGIIYLNYYYTDESAPYVDECIKSTAGMIRYNDE